MSESGGRGIRTPPGQAHPAYLTTRRRGFNLTAARTVTPVVPFVEVPAWTLGDAGGPLVDWTAWRP